MHFFIHTHITYEHDLDKGKSLTHLQCTSLSLIRASLVPLSSSSSSSYSLACNFSCIKFFEEKEEEPRYLHSFNYFTFFGVNEIFFFC